MNGMVRDSHRASGIFDNLRALFRTANSVHERLDVNELTLSVLQMLREELKEHEIASEVELAPRLASYHGPQGSIAGGVY